jgi:hypothetical protein
MPDQYDLILFSRHHDAERAEVPMLPELSWKTVEILGDVFGRIAGEFHGRGAWTWTFDIHLALAPANDLVPAAPKEPDILKAFDRQMEVNRSALLTFQDGDIGHRVAAPGQHPAQAVQIPEDLLSILEVGPVGEGDQMIRADRQAFAPDLSLGSGPRPLLILLFVGRPPFTASLTWPGIRFRSYSEVR